MLRICKLMRARWNWLKCENGGRECAICGHTQTNEDGSKITVYVGFMQEFSEMVWLYVAKLRTISKFARENVRTIPNIAKTLQCVRMALFEAGRHHKINKMPENACDTGIFMLNWIKEGNSMQNWGLIYPNDHAIIPPWGAKSLIIQREVVKWKSF